MSVTYATVPGWVLFTDISAQAVRLYALLDHYAEDALPRGNLAAKMWCSRATFDRAMRELVRIEAVTAVQRWQNAAGETVPYRDEHHRVHAPSVYLLRAEPPIGLVAANPPSARPIRSKKRISLRIRLTVYERDGYACVKCGTHKDLSLDHKIPEAQGGSATLENLQTMCRPCNLQKGVRPA